MELDAVQKQLAAAGSFRDRDRFEVRALLGRGGMGSVYRVHDRKFEAEVALKLLTTMNGAAIMRFKREFRSLARFSHPNLVSLYELLVAQDTWLFTMELVRGVAIDGYLKQRSYDHAHNTPLDPKNPIVSPVGDYARLRLLLGQLADGVAALHDAGYLHCDIKPSNILVTDDERVVLLDFGLITAIDPTERVVDEVFGTPAYTSPERATGAELTPASDWFSIGALLYRLLSGRSIRPRWLTTSDELGAALPEVVAPSVIVSGIPDDLDRLCMSLISESPEDRPVGAEVLRRLGVTHRGNRASSRPGHPGRSRRPGRTGQTGRTGRPGRPGRLELIGRASHLDGLRDALRAVERGTGQVIHVRGAPGVGKTTLIHHFLDEIADDPDAVILRSRCYLRESLPHKALDGLVDALCNYLMVIPAARARALLPDDMNTLVRVFPLLDQVIRRSEDPGSPPGDTTTSTSGSFDLQGLQLRAALALRRLLARIAEDHRLILFIDDLQWGDIDSAPFLDALIRPPDTPRLLLIVAYRTDDRDRTNLLEALLSRAHWDSAMTPTRVIDVDALEPDDATALAASSLRAAGGQPESAHDIARESDGTPLFIQELVQAAVHHPLAAKKSPTLHALIRARLDEFDDVEQQMLELLAVAGKPLAIRVIRSAVGFEPGDQADALQRLRATHWLRISHDGDGEERVELYHDRLREIIAATLDDEIRRDRFRRLARITADSPVPDAETLATYYQEAGDRESAALYTLLAADEATSALSFAHAAALYHRALELGQHPPGKQQQILVTLGEMHKAAGHLRDAVKAFSAAAELSEGIEAIDLHRRAAGEQMRSGDTTAGSNAMIPVFAEVGLTMPRSRLGTVARIVYWRLRLRLRGLDFRPRDVQSIPTRERLRAHACLDVATGMFQSAQMVAAAFSVRALHHSLEIGDRDAVLAAMTSEIGFGGALGRLRYAGELRAMVDRLIDTTRIEEQAIALRCEMQIQLFSGHFAAAYRIGTELREFIRRFPARRDVYSLLWLREVVAQYCMLALYIQNNFVEMARVAPAYLAEFSASGNRPGLVTLQLFSMPILYLNAGDPVAARAAVDDALELWGPGDFMVPHFTALLDHVLIDLYCGEGRAALQRCEQASSQVRRSLLLQTEFVRVCWYYFRSLAALAAAHDGHPRRARLVRQAGRDARRLQREDRPWITGMATLLDSNIAMVENDHDTAKARLDDAARIFDGGEMPIWASYSRWVLGHLLGGDSGRRMVTRSEAVLAPLQTSDQSRMIRLFAPTFDPGGDPEPPAQPDEPAESVS